MYKKIDLKTNFHKYIYCLVISFFFILAYNNYFFQHIFLGNQSIFNIIIYGVIAYITSLSLTIVEKKIRKNCILFSSVLSLVLVIGQPIYQYGHLGSLFESPYKILLTFISLIGFAMGLGYIFSLFIYYLLKRTPLSSSTPWKIYKYSFLWGIMFFLSWLPCYLAYYPGIFSYDIDTQTLEALGIQPIARYHPPLHTLFWKICLIIEHNSNLNALVIYSLVQMSLFAIVLTYFLNFLIKKKTNNWIILCTILFFCLNPTVALFSFIPTKDALFSVCLMFFTTELCKFVFEKENYVIKIFNNIRFILAGTLCCLLRNNMIYALIPSAIIILFLLKRYQKSLILWISGIVILYSLVNGPIYSAMGIEEGNPREMLSVPMQQISYVVANYQDTLSEQDLADINKYLSVEDLPSLYNPRLADPVKVTFNTNYYKEDSSTFIKVWIRLFLQYPDEYIVSFLNLNIPYWYPDANSNDPLSCRTYIETYVYPVEVAQYEVIRDSKIPFLYNIYEKVASYLLFDTLPIISNFFSISTPLWALLTTILILKIKKVKQLTVIFIPSLLYWCTFLLGPVSNFRYVFPITLLYPLMLALILQSENFEDSKSI